MKVKIEHVKMGDLIRNSSHPQAGLGIVIEVDEHAQYVIGVWPEHGEQIAYSTEIEVISESR